MASEINRTQIPHCVRNDICSPVVRGQASMNGYKLRVCVAGVLLAFAVAARAQEAEEAKSVLQRVFPALVARPEGEENFRAGRVTYRGIVFNDVQGTLALTQGGYFFSGIKAA